MWGLFEVRLGLDRGILCLNLVIQCVPVKPVNMYLSLIYIIIYIHIYACEIMCIYIYIYVYIYMIMKYMYMYIYICRIVYLQLCKFGLK